MATEVIIITPSHEEYRAVADGLLGAEFDHFTVRVAETGPGKINTAAETAALLAARPSGAEPLLLIGAGVAGSLSLKLKAGDMVASEGAIIGDWQMESDYARTFGAYGQPSYRAPDGPLARELTLAAGSPLPRELADRLTAKGFHRGNLLTTDTLFTGLSAKLEQGRRWNCLAADSESGALAWVAEKKGLPWLNLRVISDTIDENLRPTDKPDLDILEVLALKLLVALSVLDQLPLSSGCACCSNPSCKLPFNKV